MIDKLKCPSCEGKLILDELYKDKMANRYNCEDCNAVVYDEILQLEYKYIRFEKLENNIKAMFEVRSKRGNLLLGIVSWKHNEDKPKYYAISVVLGLFGQDLLDIAHFIKQLMDERG